MPRVRILNKSRDSVLGAQVLIADRWWARMRGFLWRPEPAAGEGILLSPCRAVHMIGMSYPLDIIFVNRHGRVVAVYAELPPGGRSGYHISAEYALEVPAGTIAATGTKEQDLLVWLPSQEESSANGGAHLGDSAHRSDAREKHSRGTGVEGK